MSSKVDTKQEARRGLKPKLRFPEFRDGLEWEEKPLGNICDYWNGASHEGAITDSGDFYLISLNSIDIEGNLKHDMKRLSATDNSLRKNDLVMVLSDVAHGNFLGLTDIIPNNKFVLNQRMAGLRLRNADLANVRFLRTFINLNQKYFKQQGQGSSQLNLSKSSVTEFPVLFPSIEEQQKIADCLSSLDELITAESQKLEHLQTHKKGLMQQLFPAEGETVPKLRFPEFEGGLEWQEARLGEQAHFASGGTPSKDVPEYWGGTIPWISASSMYETNIAKSELNITELAVSDGARIAKKGSLLILVRGSMLHNRIPMGIAMIDVAFNQDVKALVYGNNIAGYFLLYQLMAAESRILDSVGETGIGAGKIETDDLKKFTICVPSHREQQKIADCLSSLDDLISAQKQKIDLLKSHKKGLMQQLFPTPDEVQA